jgi:hypothetical protein
MFRPNIDSWIEQSNETFAKRVDPRLVRPFMQITSRTRDCQIRLNRHSTMLASDYMFYLKKLSEKSLRNLAILTVAPRPFDDKGS